MKSEVIVFKGIKFRRYPESEDRSLRVYYRPHAGHIRNGVGHLHVEIWKDAYGPVPEGFHIHHKDGNPLHNELENLEAKPISKHLSDHDKDREYSLDHLEKLRAGAIKWHKSEAGRKWHRENGINNWKAKKPVMKICVECGKSFQTLDIRKYGRFCSDTCKSNWRRKSGVDDEERICVICGKRYITNKYRKSQTCSRPCRQKLRWSKTA